MRGTKTGGREKGTPNKKTHEFLQKVLGSGKTPLEILIEASREREPEKPKLRKGAKPGSPEYDVHADAIKEWEKRWLAWRERVLDAAGKAAPYCHPKLMASVNPADWEKPPVQKVEVSFV